MERWYTRAKRGDVWYVSLNRETGDGITGSSVQQKSRPYLIVSSDQHNATSPTFNAVPITTRPSDKYPMHVYFRVEDEKGGRDQLVLCEQITTLSLSLLEKTYSHFMYHMTDTFMAKVDAALAIQLGLSLKVPELTDLESLIDKLAERKLDEIRRKNDEEIAERVAKITESLKAKFEVQPQPVKRPCPKSEPDPDPNLNEEFRKRGRLRTKGDPWTPDLIQQFLTDAEQLDSKTLGLIYGLATTSVRPTVRHFQRLLSTETKK